MSHEFSRRSFLKTGALLGASSLVGGKVLAELAGPAVTPVQAAEKSTIVAVTSADAFAAARRAVDELGGMQKFVAPGARVAVLANVQRNNPGTYTKPEIVRAVIEMCRESAAREIAFVSWLPQTAWDAAGLTPVITAGGATLTIADRKDESLFAPVPVPRGKALKDARIMKDFLDYDVFINVPVTKDHLGNRFTGTLKNLMGLNSPVSNRTFHQENWATDAGAIAHLEQCIADLNTVVTPDLCLVDATEFIITNGPFGPGELLRPQQVVAGTDRVALDAYCCTLWGLKPEEILSIRYAAEHGLGRLDPSAVHRKDITL
ncbi:MAG: DUF362 domain-containing protein [Acidobacteria bacterium]|nr:DUF362 domain-containing protein [Acidobacteriota bacterium]